MTTLFKSTRSTSGSTSSKIGKFDEILPLELEEITHFDRNSRPSSSIVGPSEVAGSSSSSYAFGFDRGAPRSIYSNSNNGNSLGKTGGGGGDGNKNPFVIHHGGGGESESNSDNDDFNVFNRAENYKSDILDRVTGVEGKIESSGGGGVQSMTRVENDSRVKYKGTESEENLCPSFNDSFVLNVKRADVLLDAIVLFVIVTELLLEISLISFYYHDSQTWAAALTTFFLLAGTGSSLHQFNLLTQDQIKRLFNRGKRIRIVVNCFPPLASILSAFQCVLTGYRARGEPMLSGQYLEIENFLKSISKTQSFFQAAPQSTLQLLLFMEALDSHNIGLVKGCVCVSSIITSLTVMTNASLPSKAENPEHLRKTTQRPSIRIFVGIRMFSSFASRSIGVTSLLIGCRCLLRPNREFSGTMIAISIVTLPRVIIAFVEFVRLIVVRRKTQDQVPTSGHHKVSCYGIFMGYLATILFPVGDPVWIFLYIWGESALFVIAGNIIGWSKGCLINAVNATYTGTFLVLFIIIPILIPYAKASIKHRQGRLGVSRTFRQSQEMIPSSNVQSTT